MNLKILFLKAEKVLEFFIFNSKLFRSMTVDEKKRIYKKILFTTKEGNLIISSCIIWFANARMYSEEIFRRLTLKYFEKVAEVPTIVFYRVILSLVLNKVFFQKYLLQSLIQLMQLYIVLTPFFDERIHYKFSRK